MNTFSPFLFSRRAAQAILERKMTTEPWLHSHIKRIAQNNGGSFNMSKSELAAFFKQTMAYNPPKHEIDQIFELADTKSDALSIKEFLIVFGWSVKEFKSVPPPPKPKGVLTRAATFAMPSGSHRPRRGGECNPPAGTSAAQQTLQQPWRIMAYSY